MVFPDMNESLEYSNINCIPASGVNHRVGRVLSFSQVVGIGTPNLSPAGECVPPLWFWGEGHTLWRYRGWESPNSDEGTYTVVLFYIYTYFVG
jgi:hypothetical protein